MTIMVLLALAAIWAAVLVPPYLQKRRATHPSSSVVDFNQQLAVLQRTGRALDGAPLQEGYAPRAHQALPHAATHAPIGRSCLTRTDVLRRRRDVVVTLASAVALTFLLAVALGGNVWLLHLLADAAFLGYVALLLHIKESRRLPVQGANVRYLQQSRPSSTQQALLRRSAN